MGSRQRALYGRQRVRSDNDAGSLANSDRSIEEFTNRTPGWPEINREDAVAGARQESVYRSRRWWTERKCRKSLPLRAERSLAAVESAVGAGPQNEADAEVILAVTVPEMAAERSPLRSCVNVTVVRPNHNLCPRVSGHVPVEIVRHVAVAIGRVGIC